MPISNVAALLLRSQICKRAQPLAAAQADLRILAWTSPGGAYIVCTNPRSGSWLLSDGLARTGVAGNPREWFNVMEEQQHRARFRMDNASDLGFPTYLRIARAQRDAERVVGRQASLLSVDGASPTSRGARADQGPDRRPRHSALLSWGPVFVAPPSR